MTKSIWQPLTADMFDQTQISWISDKMKIATIRLIFNDMNKEEQLVGIGQDFKIKERYKGMLLVHTVDNEENIPQELFLYFSRFEMLVEDDKFIDVDFNQYALLSNGEYHKITKIGHFDFGFDNHFFNKSDGFAVRPSEAAYVKSVVPASQVIVDFGSFRGVIKKNSTSNFFVYAPDNYTFSLIRFDMLVSEKLTEVELLLESIAKEQNNGN